VATADQKLRQQTWRGAEETLREKHQIEELLRAELDKAEAEFRVTTETFRQLTALNQDPGANDPNGEVSLDQAVQAYNCAMGKYRAALQNFNDFILHGKVPRENT
jgi:hypothetical protein